MTVCILLTVSEFNEKKQNRKSIKTDQETLCCAGFHVSFITVATNSLRKLEGFKISQQDDTEEDRLYAHATGLFFIFLKLKLILVTNTKVSFTERVRETHSSKRKVERLTPSSCPHTWKAAEITSIVKNLSQVC